IIQFLYALCGSITTVTDLHLLFGDEWPWTRTTVDGVVSALLVATRKGLTTLTLAIHNNTPPVGDDLINVTLRTLVDLRSYTEYHTRAFHSGRYYADYPVTRLASLPPSVTAYALHVPFDMSDQHPDWYIETDAVTSLFYEALEDIPAPLLRPGVPAHVPLIATIRLHLSPDVYFYSICPIRHDPVPGPDDDDSDTEVVVAPDLGSTFGRDDTTEDDNLYVYARVGKEYPPFSLWSYKTQADLWAQGEPNYGSP
ncbi:hypothetical protein P7C70_g8993, partial [Phenoliferia sp. Uapishka_3]